MLQRQEKMMQKTYSQQTYPLKVPWEDSELNFQVLGIFKSNGRFQWNQVSPKHCFHIIQEGEGHFNVDEKTYTAGKNKIFTFFPGQYISYHDFPETPWNYIWFNFGGNNVDRALAAAGITKQNPLIDISKNIKFKSTLSNITEKIINDTYKHLFPIAAAWNLLSLVADPALETSSETQHLYEAGKILIDSQLDNNLTVDELADRLEVNRSTLFRAFKKQSGISPKEFIDHKRFEQAKELLIRSEMPIKQIANACGFVEHHYFSNAFRKRFGITPGEYRVRQEPSMRRHRQV